jgi:hypothetical protein
MRRKGFLIALTALLLGAVVTAGATLAGHTPVATATATQHPVNQSGVMGEITIVDSATGPSYAGTATGLAPLAPLFRYLTLVYDVGSVSGGPTACEPTAELPLMFVGTWAVDAVGNGTLIQLAPTEPLDAIDTISIRDTTINSGFGPEAVVACGQIAVHPAAP